MIQLRSEWYQQETAFSPDSNKLTLTFKIERRLGMETATVNVSGVTQSPAIRRRHLDLVRDSRPPTPGATAATRGLLAKRFKGTKPLSHKEIDRILDEARRG
jgi:hypothetical protein